jgi:hypothetical protein
MNPFFPVSYLDTLSAYFMKIKQNKTSAGAIDRVATVVSKLDSAGLRTD